MMFEKQIARKPNHYPWAQDFIDAMWAGFWTPNEFDFKSDYNQFLVELNNDEKELITRVLTAIGQIEIDVKTFWANLGKNLPHPYLNDLGYVMANSEVIHNQAYEKLIDVLGMQDSFQSNLQIPVMKNRVNYLKKHLSKEYNNERKQYIYSIILFTLFVENVSLFSQFYVITWFNRFKNLLKDTAQQVQYTRNEELLHAQIGTKIINTLQDEYPEYFDEELKNKIIDEAWTAYEAESELIDWMVGSYYHENMNAELLKKYVRIRLDTSLRDIKFPTQFNDEYDKRLLWMDEEVYGNNMTDFFHKRPVEYSKHSQPINADEIF